MEKKIFPEFNPMKIHVKMDNNDFRALLKRTRGELNPALPHNEEGKINNDEESRKVKAARAEGHKKKKENYIKMKQIYENSLLELSQKYRDRAQERRDRTNNEPSLNDELIKTSGYHAVAPDIKSGINAQEIRHKLIEESKYLGGDLEHTHLVKGLDYALLQKVREEIKLKEEDKGHLNTVNTQVSEKGKEKNEVICKSYLANQIYKNAFPSKDVKMNALFVPGRMAYVMDLLDDGMDTDIPTVVIRSKSEIPNNQATTLTSVNDIVINKLTQILSYLRQGSINVKKSKKKNDKYIDQIFDGEYLCPPKNINTRPEQNKQTKEKTRIRKEMKSRETQIGTNTCRKSTKHDLFSRLTAAPTGYAECYPGQDEMNDAIEDSDDEIDYTKMDLGCQKGSVGRWDFDSQEEYNQYLNNKEALPKAAFQYGLKMNDGRRTRKYNKKNEKGEINQEWNTIRSMIMKRKENPSGESDLFLLPYKLSRKC